MRQVQLRTGSSPVSAPSSNRNGVREAQSVGEECEPLCH